MNAFLSRPSVLRSTLAPKSWGWEKWLTSTRAEAPATIEGTGTPLAEKLRAHPEALGRWARLLFGDEKPIFSKLIATTFPPHVHVGFRRAVTRGEFLAWLLREQELLREFFVTLRVPDERAFAQYQSLYSTWATRQALAGWRLDDEESLRASLSSFVDSRFDVRAWAREVRKNRAQIVDSLHEIDLRRELGNLLLTGAGVVHAIFGLSHQTHPKDPARPALEELFARLADLELHGASEEELENAVKNARLAELRGHTTTPPKNEAWLPAVVDGVDGLAEPQQTSDTTYSLADFYTPFTWANDGGVQFRKGAKREGLSLEQLAHHIAEVDFEVAAIDGFRRAPKSLAGGSSEGGELFRLLDEPTTWPFFTAYQLELTGRVELAPSPGVFQELIVTRGRVTMSDGHGALGELSLDASAFIPGTLAQSSVLTAREPSSVLLFSVPGVYAGGPRLLRLDR